MSRKGQVPWNKGKKANAAQRAALDAGRAKSQQMPQTEKQRQAREAGRRKAWSLPRSEKQKAWYKAFHELPMTERQLEALRAGRMTVKGKPAWNHGLRVTDPETLARLRRAHLGQEAWNEGLVLGDKAQRVEARRLVGKALRRGDLIKKSTCERCGQLPATEAHHADYSKPLEVEWLCDTCHDVTKREAYAEWLAWAVEKER